MGRGLILIRMFVLKVINNERKISTHHETTDRIAEKNESVISGFIRTYGGHVSHLIIHLSSLTFVF